MTDSAPSDTQPLDVIEAEVKATRLAIDVSRQVVQALLDQRLRLLEAGWTDSNEFCRELDRDAERWAAQREHNARALRKLLEGDR